MICYRDDPDYAAAYARRGVVGIEIAQLTNQLDNFQLIYLRDGVLTPARVRAELAEKRSALRLEDKLLADALLTIKARDRLAVRQDLLNILVDVLNEHGLEHYLKMATDRRDAV